MGWTKIMESEGLLIAPCDDGFLVGENIGVDGVTRVFGADADGIKALCEHLREWAEEEGKAYKTRRALHDERKREETKEHERTLEHLRYGTPFEIASMRARADGMKACRTDPDAIPGPVEMLSDTREAQEAQMREYAETLYGIAKPYLEKSFAMYAEAIVAAEQKLRATKG